MTDIFWIIAAIFVLLALGFIVWPLLHARTESRIHRDLRNQNLLAYRTRMAELDKELEEDLIDQEHYRQLKQELAGSMLDDVPEEGSRGAPRSRVSGRRSALGVVLVSIAVLPAAAVYLYQQWGALNQVEAYQAMSELSDSDAARAQRMSELAGQLRERLEAEPENPEGWVMLGRTYMRIEQYQDAVYAYRRLAQLDLGTAKERANAWGLAAQAAFFASQGEMNEQVQDIIEKARELDPNEVNVLGLLGINAFSQENYREAIGYWQRIVDVAPRHPQLASIKEGLRAAYGRLGEEPPAELQASAGGGVTVRVELDEQFVGDIPDDAVVFVFVRRAGVEQGPPLAAMRLPASSLPTEVTLDDRNSMGPAGKLSSAEEVQVMARISRTGNAKSEAGDWQGRIDRPVAVGDDSGEVPVLVIDSRLAE
jgi:cytochrome c-type biogenesis protein CcmH